MLEFIWAAHWGVKGVVRAGSWLSLIPPDTCLVCRSVMPPPEKVLPEPRCMCATSPGWTDTPGWRPTSIMTSPRHGLETTGDFSQTASMRWHSLSCPHQSEVKQISFQIIVQAEGYDSQAKLVQISNGGHSEGRETLPRIWIKNIFFIFSYKTGFRSDAPHWFARRKSDERIRGHDVTRTLWGDKRDYNLLFADCNQILLLGPEDWRLSRLIQTIKVSSNIQYIYRFSYNISGYFPT